MCGSDRLETSCHSGAILTRLRRMGRARFAENIGKTGSVSDRPRSITPGEGNFAPGPQQVTVARRRRTHYDALYLELVIREALPLASLHPGERDLAAQVGAVTA